MSLHISICTSDVLDAPIIERFRLVSDSEIEVAATELAKSSFVERRSVARNCEPKYDKSYEMPIDKFFRTSWYT